MPYRGLIRRRRPAAPRERRAARNLVLSSPRLLAPIERLIDALCDPARRTRAMLGLAVVYALAWTLYAVVAKSTQDINTDMAELVVWTRELALGYPKHPPFTVWLIKAWFAVFPLTDWAYYLLAGLMLGTSLLLAFLLAGEWLQGEKRAAVPFLLAVIPFYNFLGLKFDHNTALIPLWALTLWAFMRSYDTRHVGWAVLAGLAAAASILTKYWSVLLLASLFIAALADRRRNAYFRSAAPWISGALFVLAVEPHAVWLVREGFQPFTYVAVKRAALSIPEWLHSLVEFSAGTFGYASPALLLGLYLARPSLAATRDSWLPRDNERRTAAVLFWAPLLLPFLAAALTRTVLLSLWNTPALNLLPVMMLSSPLVVLARERVVRVATAAAIFTALALIASPLVAVAVLELGVENHAAYGRLVAAELEREWKQVTDKPIRLLAGPFYLANTTAFYIGDRPSTYADFSSYLSPWVDARRIVRQGIAIACPVDDPECLVDLDKIVSQGLPGRRTEVELRRHWLGLAGAPRRFVLAVVPPL